MALFKAINEVWYEVNREVVPNPKLDICKSVVYCQELPTSQSLQPAPLKPMNLK